MASRTVYALLLVAVAAGAFAVGRGAAHRRVVAGGSFAAGREAAFAGFDGGWAYGQPYIVVLQRGGPGVTYRFASRRPLLPGFVYRRCGQAVCATR